MMYVVICLHWQYLKIVRHMDGYGDVLFPHCACDSRRDGHVIAIIGLQCFKLQACKEDGTAEVLHSIISVLSSCHACTFWLIWYTSMSVWNSLPEALGHSDSFSSFKTSSQLSCVVTVPKLSLSLPSISGYVCVCVQTHWCMGRKGGCIHSCVCVC